MDWETMEAIEPQAGETLERAMARYARLRLEPSTAQARRARAAVMEAAWRSRLQSESEARRTGRRSVAAGRRWIPFSTWNLRRISLAASAAVFAGLLLGTSVFAASRAGGPLYGARIALEDVTLPADPASRLQAQIANAQVRLAEAYDAESRNDQVALTAALSAYSVDATTLAETTGPGTAQALAAVEQHRDVLLALIQQANAEALPGLNQALASSDKAIELLSAGGNGNGNGAGGNGNGNGGTGGNGSGGTGGNSGGAGGGQHPVTTPAPSPRPAATPNPPDHTPKPAPTPKPTATPKPSHSPKGGPQTSDASSTLAPSASPSPSVP
ncbi:MAG TPA: hypothetical protein VIR16_00830 [Candidatus Limnocylindrales bacterium]